LIGLHENLGLSECTEQLGRKEGVMMNANPMMNDGGMTMDMAELTVSYTTALRITAWRLCWKASWKVIRMLKKYRPEEA
jgi:hypothetical protein